MTKYLLSALALAYAGLVHSTPHAFTVDDLWSMQRVDAPVVSPDGQFVVFAVATPSMETNKTHRDLYWRSVNGKDEAKRLTHSEASDSSPSWSPDGKYVYFLSTRSTTSQLWRISLSGGEAEQVSHYPFDINAYKLAAHGDKVLLSFDVDANCETLTCSVEADQASKAHQGSGMLYDKLFVRHWDTWADHHLARLFIDSVDGDRVGGKPLLLSKLDADVPSKPHGDESEWDISADGKTIYFAARIKGRTEAWSTNLDIYQINADGSGLLNLTAGNQATDTQPALSPDNKQLAWLAMSRPMFESDKLRVLVRDLGTGGIRDLTANLDRSASDLHWSPDGKTLFITADDNGNHSLFAIDVKTGAYKRLIDKATVSGVAIAGKNIVYGYDSLQSPVELYRMPLTGGPSVALTSFNAERLAALQMGESEPFTFAGANNETVHGWLVKPAHFDANKKYPIAFLVHGGPQGSFGNHFHYRWNAQTYTGQDFAVVMIDFHGSTGYGQAFTDAISGDWGGKPFIDLQKGLAAATEKYHWLDADRACALGGSYGGYMMNWIEGNWPDRFRCIVDHAGIFDGRSMYYSTEEIWFDEWEHGGPQFDRPDVYEKYNPVNYVNNWKTPMLVIHGQKDFRIPYVQGIESFTALQRKNIPSELLIFPDENHWILKPQNSKQWHESVNAWLHRWMDK